MADLTTTHLRVKRGVPGDNQRYDDFEVPYQPGMSVLDAILWVRSHRDSSLAVRYGCVNANACKTCMALVESKVTYLCIAPMDAGGVTVEPLASRPLIRDLVTDTVPDDEKLTADEC